MVQSKSNGSIGRRFIGLRAGTLSLAVAAGLLVMAEAAPARAQLFGFWPWDNPNPGLAPYDVQRIAAARGYRLLAPPYRNDRVYILDVVDARGVQERLVVDALRGTILQRYRVGEPRYASRSALPWPDAGEGAFGGERSFGDESTPIPPRSVPGGLVPDVSAAPPGDQYSEPSVVPGVGPNQVKPKKHPPRKALARSTPPPKPENAAVPPGAGPPAVHDTGTTQSTTAPPPPEPTSPAPSQAEKVTPPDHAVPPPVNGAPPPPPAPATASSSPPAPATTATKPVTPVKKPPPAPNDIPPAPLD